jgi:hypothetical protein
MYVRSRRNRNDFSDSINFLVFIGSLFFVLCTSSLTKAQMLSYQASNRMEYRLSDEDHSETFRNWLDVDYLLGDFLTGLRIVFNQPSQVPEQQATLAQRYFEINHGGLRLRFGNFYKRFGRGLLFHAFEVQKISLNRFEQNFIIDRNMDGFLLEWNGERGAFSLFSGQPSWQSPSQNLRGIEGFIQGFFPGKLYAGYLRHNASYGTILRSRNFLNAAFEWLTSRFSLFIDVAGEAPLSRAGKGTNGQAIYSSLSFFGDNIGVSVEYKDYRWFSLGFNNPPTLIREHPYSLLNRHTHQVNLNDEKGFQTELTWSPAPNTSFIINISRASNHKEEIHTRFSELYAQIRQDTPAGHVFRLAYDWSEDRSVGDKSRHTILFETDLYLNRRTSLTADVQVQTLTNEFMGRSFRNFLGVLGWSRAGRLAANVQYEWSSDPREPRHSWLMLNVNIKLGMAHDLYISIGKRRAGLACASGQCVFVPEFSGIELRLNSRF